MSEVQYSSWQNEANKGEKGILHDSSTIGAHLWLWPEVDPAKLMNSYCHATCAVHEYEYE
jgi:hypothetical protein